MDFIKEINRLKKEKNAVILTHCYQNIDIDEVADFIGDSFYLSKQAAKTNADIIVFAGVFFMAQSAKILSPDKKVLLPNKNSGCEMADMIDIDSLKEFKAKHPSIPVICYINSNAEIKANSDICCTSSNAIDVVKSLNVPKVLFVPDAHLGRYVQSQLYNVEVITYDGFCPIHLKITAQDVEQARKNYPDALILAHPECCEEVIKRVDFVGSTKAIIDFAKKSKEKRYIIATEKGVADRLNRDSIKENWGKEFILIQENLICPNMKMNTLENIYTTLLNENNEITLDENIAEKARKCIERMLQIDSVKQ